VWIAGILSIAIIEIVGISIDENKSFWEKAVEKHNMTWIQVINEKEKGTNVAEMYGVVSIPYTVLVDNNGKILCENIRGNELIKKVKSFFD
jgi:peroxiredoxin